MSEPKLENQFGPPNNSNMVIAGGFDDFIKGLGDKIASLDPKQSKELSRYLNKRGVLLK